MRCYSCELVPVVLPHPGARVQLLINKTKVGELDPGPARPGLRRAPRSPRIGCAAPRASRCPETLPARAGVTVRGQCWTCSAVLQPAQTAIARGRRDARAELMVSLRTPRARSTAREANEVHSL